MSITKRADSQEERGHPRAFVVSAEEKPPATARRRPSGETVGIDLWLWPPRKEGVTV